MGRILEKLTKRFNNKDEGEWTELRYADLSDVELDNASLDGADFRHAQFDDTDLTHKKEVEEY